MQKLLADNFQQNPGVKLTITTEEVKQLTPDVKVTRGFATVTPANGAAKTTRYTLVKVKKGDHWENFPIEREGGTASERLRETRGS